MSTIFIGFLFMFLDFNLNIGTASIGLIPDFIGALFIFIGMKELQSESVYFARNRSLSLILTIVEACIYVMDLIGLFGSLAIVGWFIHIICTAFLIVVSYYVVKGISDMQMKYNTNLEADALYTYWLVLAILEVVGTFSYFLFYIGVFVGIAALVITILFLVKLSKAKTNYELAKRNIVE